MDAIDTKYLGLIGSRLDSFTKVRDGLFNFRCPFCGDSKRKKSKRRGYIYEKGLGANVFCHNCGFSSSLPSFIKILDKSLFDSYIFDRFEFNHSINRPIEPNIGTKFATKVKFKSDNGLVSLSKSPRVHSYVLSRKIPEKFHKSLFAIPNLKEFVEKQYGGIYEHQRMREIEGLAIPFFNEADEYHYILFRSIEDKFFIFLKNGEGESPKIWGLRHLDRSVGHVIITEAPIDAMMFQNGVAVGGVQHHQAVQYLKSLFGLELIFLFDNEYHSNKFVRLATNQIIESGHSVVVFDRSFKWKDPNQAICSGGHSLDSLKQYIFSRVFSGLRARAELARSK